MTYFITGSLYLLKLWPINLINFIIPIVLCVVFNFVAPDGYPSQPFASLHRWGNWDSEKWRKLLKFTQLGQGQDSESGSCASKAQSPCMVKLLCAVVLFPPTCWLALRQPLCFSGLHFLPLTNQGNEQDGLPSPFLFWCFWASPCKRHCDRSQELVRQRHGDGQKQAVGHKIGHMVPQFLTPHGSNSSVDLLSPSPAFSSQFGLWAPAEKRWHKGKLVFNSCQIGPDCSVIKWRGMLYSLFLLAFLLK